MPPKNESCQLAEEPLEPLFELFEALGVTATVELQTPEGRGIIRIRDGRLQDAQFRQDVGGEAVRCALCATVGSYNIDYEPVPPSASEENLNESLTRLFAPNSHYSEHPIAPPVRAILERSKEPLHSGLPPVELRALSVISGSEALVAMADELDDPPHEVLRAVRSLLKRGLIKESTTRTLHLGTPVPSPHRNEEFADVSGRPRHAPVTGKKAVPAQWARGARRLSGRYSSAPPAALAEDQVHLPTSLGAAAPQAENDVAIRARQEQPEIEQEEGSEEQADRHGHPKTLPSTPPLQNLDDIDDPLVEEDFAGPRLSLSSDDWDYREPLHTIDDEVVRQAARGQLTDSEMPVPSSHLGQATLEQLGRLDHAIASSREPRLPFPDSEPNYDAESPGSVPSSQALPGNTHFNPETGLPTVGRYEVLARLKSGGMGSVYMCRLSGTAGFRRLFAMKVLHGHLADEEETLDSFFHEARVLAGLHHPNVVGIVDIGTPHEPYIVLDYVEGGSLLELFRAGDPRDGVGPIVAVILDALEGLHAAHNATDEEGRILGLVHCDVTPHNLLVGVDGTCRVTDFGIARTGDENVRGEVTRGKPGYIAPERLRRQMCDHRADLFSLGVVLYTGLTGEEPFYASTAEETMQNVLKKALDPPSEVGNHPPPAFDWVCAKALARNPDERFQSAEEMAMQLRRVAARENLLATPAEVARWVKKSLAPTLAARKAASQRGTVPPSDRGKRSSIPARAQRSGSPHAPASLEQLAEAPSVEESGARDHTGPLAPADTINPEENTEVLDSMMPSAGRLARRVFLYLALVFFIGVLVYAVLFPDDLGQRIRPGAHQAPTPLPAMVDPKAKQDPTGSEQTTPDQETGDTDAADARRDAQTTTSAQPPHAETGTTENQGQGQPQANGPEAAQSADGSKAGKKKAVPIRLPDIDSE